MPNARPSIFYIDLLRFIAAIAVVIIHVLGPFRFLYGDIAESDWLAAMGFNSASRWAVPVFMMISGALLISDKRPFNGNQYISRRLGKVLVPFIAWTIIYAFIGGFEGLAWNAQVTNELLVESSNEPVWYHLWFFYDFIPLYFVIPLLAPLLYKMGEERVKLLLAAWAFLTLMHMLKVETPLRQNILLYSGYLVLGWYLFNRDNRSEIKLWVMAGVSTLVLNFIGSWYFTTLAGEYSVFFMGYKSVNTVIIAGMLFVVMQAYAERIQGRFRAVVGIISKYSLGIYLIHPIILIPIRELDNGFYAFFGSNWIAIPVLSVFTLVIALACSVILVKIPFVRRIVP